MGTRVELRCPDPSCNPYLNMAVCLAAGLDGIEKGLTPPEEITENIFAMDAATREAKGIESLPGTLYEAVKCLKADKVICEALGEHVLSQYVEGKEKEWDAYRTHVSKWETDQCSPDTLLLPKIADVFGITIDALFGRETARPEAGATDLPWKDDDVIRIIQMRGKKVLAVTPRVTLDAPAIEITFPRNCNDRTQYFKVEIYGHVISDSSINGDVVCHQTIKSSTINGDVKSEGNIDVNELNAQKVICNNITDCYKLQAKTIECAGNVASANLTCDQIIYKK
jgi:transcriptional regulator with XRE-family HTH domain